MTLIELQALRDSGEFHHATYRNEGTLHEGLWIYRRSADGFRGYEPVGAFFKNDPNLKAAEDILRGTGISYGSFGNG